jgi:hypothetical protein
MACAAAAAVVAAVCASCLQEGAAAESLADVRYKLLNIGLLTAGIGHCLVLQVRMLIYFESATPCATQ